MKDRIKDLEKRGIVQKIVKEGGRKLPPPLQIPDGINIQEILQEDRNSKGKGFSNKRNQSR